MLTIGLMHYLIVATLLFCMGIFVMATKRNAIGILIGVELVLNAASLNLVAFGRYRHGGAIEGQMLAIFVIVLAAAEAALAVAIAMNFYKNLNTIDVDRGTALRQ